MPHRANTFRDRSERLIEPALQLTAQNTLITGTLRHSGSVRLRFRGDHGHVKLRIASRGERDAQIQGVTARRGRDVTYKDSTGWNWHGVLLTFSTPVSGWV